LKVALPYWQKRISPVLDTSSNFLIVDIRKSNQVSSLKVNLVGKSPYDKALLLKEQGVSLLLCGAISDNCRCVFVSNGIEVVSWLKGDIDYIIGAYINGSLNEPGLLMPGRQSCRRRRIKKRGNNFRNEKDKNKRRKT